MKLKFQAPAGELRGMSIIWLVVFGGIGLLRLTFLPEGIGFWSEPVIIFAIAVSITVLGLWFRSLTCAYLLLSLWVLGIGFNSIQIFGSRDSNKDLHIIGILICLYNSKLVRDWIRKFHRGSNQVVAG